MALWWLMAVVTAGFVLWIANWRPWLALALAVGVAAPMLVVMLVGWLRR